MISSLQPYQGSSPHSLHIQNTSQIRKLILRRSQPSTLSFNNDEPITIDHTTTKKLATILSKRTNKLKNPPLRSFLRNRNTVDRLKKLEITPEDAARYISKITRRISRLQQFAILDDTNSFSPMRIKKKINPLRLLKTFIYNHEFCLDFMKCAIFATSLKIRKTSLDLTHLQRFVKLETIYLILKNKYITLPEEETKYIKDLAKVLLKLPAIHDVVYEQEIDPENQLYSYSFLALNNLLKGKAKLHLVADFVDVSNLRSRNNTVEKIMQTIVDSGISSLKVDYVGAITTKRLSSRCFYAPIHLRKELYTRFLTSFVNAGFTSGQMSPIVHSYHIDNNLKEGLLQLMNPNSRVNIPNLTIVYNLDSIQFDTFDLLLDLYNHAIPSYELVIISTVNVRKGLLEKLEQHYSAVLAKVQRFKSQFSLQITARNLCGLTSLVQIIAPRVNLSLVKSLNVQVIDPINKVNMKSITKILKKSSLCDVVRNLEISISQKETPRSDDIVEFLGETIDKMSKLQDLKFSYYNSIDCRNQIRESFDKLKNESPNVRLSWESLREQPTYNYMDP